MKKTLLFVFGLSVAIVGKSQCESFGTTTTLSSSNHLANTLMGQMISVTETGTLKSVGIGDNTQIGDPQVKVGIYSDDNGKPGQLLTENSAVQTLYEGNNSIALNEIQISPGNYWVMKVLDASSIIYDDNVYQNSQTTYYMSYSFSNALPQTYGGTTKTYSDTFSIWMEVCPNVTNSSQISINSSIVFPNPTNGLLNLSFENPNLLSQINIRTIDGKIAETIYPQDITSSQITINGAPGIYFIELISGKEKQTYKIIKK